MTFANLKKGNIVGIIHMGNVYYYGLAGVTQNYDRAYKYYKSAADAVLHLSSFIFIHPSMSIRKTFANAL